MIGSLGPGIEALAIEQRFASGKTVFDAMPMGDVGLADLPTQKNYFLTEQERKIDQALLHAFADTTVSIDLIDAILKLPDQARNLIVALQLIHQVRCIGIDPSRANNFFAGAFEASEVFEDLFDQRPYYRQELFGFVDGEKPRKGCVAVHRSICHSLAQIIIRSRRSQQLEL
jgi:hypothetical protein